MSNQNPRKIMISVAPNGGRHKKDYHQAMPLTQEEIVQCAVECHQAGASMFHAHIRDENGDHLLDIDAYKSLIAAIDEKLGDDLLVQITTEAIGKYGAPTQMEIVRGVKPKAVSLALKELMPSEDDEAAFSDFMHWVKEAGILPQIILYAPEEAVQLKSLMDRNVIPYDDIAVLYVLGRYTVGQVSSPNDLLAFLAEGQPQFGHWTVCAFGQNEQACVTTACLLGGNVRIGFENNILLPNGDKAQNNAENIANFKAVLDQLGLEPAHASDLVEAWQAY